MRPTLFAHIITTLLACLGTSASVGCELQSYRFFTEHSPPFSYQLNGTVEGLAVDRVKRIAELAGCPLQDKQFSLQPWGRAYANALRGPKTALFSISQTEERQPLFHWVGPIGSGIYGAYGKRSLGLLPGQDLTSQNLIWGVVQNDIGEHYARELGISPAHVQRAPRPVNLARQLMAERIHLWIYSQTGVLDALNELGATPDDYRMFLLIERNDFYLAFSLDTPASVVQQLQQANQQITAGDDLQ